MQNPTSKTHQSRINIGFDQDRNNWQTSPATYSNHDLTINGHPVMEDWERQYMSDLATVSCRHGGKILEVGYGMGISAGYIQGHTISEHVIIEANQDVFVKLLSFANQNKNVRPLYGFWEDITPLLADNSFDGVLFDTYPLTESEIHCNHFPFFPEAYRLLKPGGTLTYYSDEIDDYSPAHVAALSTAGFKNIQKTHCHITPPSDCLYWQEKKFVTPIITK